jgi:E3 ubiquitin-protein ligase HUWE1
MDAALGFRANVFQVMRPGSGGPNSGGKKSSHVIHSSSIQVHPQAAPIVCKHTLELLISLAKSFPIHFLPPREPREEATAAGPSSSEPARTPAKSSTKQPEFWDTLLKLDRECWSSRKGKSVVRSHSAVGAAGGANASKSADHHEEDGHRGGLGGSSAFGQLLSMLASPVIRRSSLLTDKLLRLLSLISLGQPDVLRRLDEAEKERTGGAGAAVPVGTFQAAGTAAVTSLNIDKTVREDQIQLAVEVLTSKACSEEGLEDVTALLLNLSYGGSRTREAILRLLLAGARELGHVVSGHVSALLCELADIKAAGGLPTLPEEDESARQRGVLSDRFTKESVVLTAPAKPKAGGGELQLSSMSALTNKTSSQSFFLRVLKVIIQLREAALLAIKKMLKAKKEAENQLETLKSIQSSLNREAEEEEQEREVADPSGEHDADTTAPTSQVCHSHCDMK